jgi:hypothetical protein
MVIPRENKLVRLYIQITTTEKGAKVCCFLSLDRDNHILTFSD